MPSILVGVSSRAEVPPAILAELRAVCLGLPEAYEEEAWAGTRWMVARKNFAHVLVIADGWPPVYARAAGTDGPAAVLTFRSTGPELDVLAHAGPPFFSPVWHPEVIGLVLGADADWDEITELLTDSYCHLAPRRLAALVDRPPP
jgi:hypothetical protein